MTAANRRTDIWLVVAAVVAWLAFAAAFGLPGRTLDWGRDLLVFFGQINALEHGQVPYRDFRTSMGLLPFYLPWFGYRLVGDFGGALEIGGLLATALLLPCIVVALRTRFRLPIALALLLCLAAMAAVPADHVLSLPSQVGFYNRWSCAALAALFLFAVPPKRESSAYLEGAALAGLLLFLFFVKATYFAVGLCFVVGFGAALGLFRRAALIGIGTFATVVLAAHGATGLIDDYFAELAHSFNVSGVAWYADDKYLMVRLPRSATYYVVLASACVFAAVGKANLRWRHWAFVLYALITALAIQGHDASSPGPFALMAPLALFGELAATAWRRWHVGLLALFMLPYLAAAPRTAVDYGHDGLPRSELPRMASAFIEDLSIAGIDRRYFWHCLFFLESELRPGLRLLRQNGVADDVLGLDYYNYFPALLDVPPLPGRLAVLMPDRTLNRDTAPSPATVFRHARYVMVPRESTKDRRLLLALYGEHLRTSYQLLDGNDHWQLWERNDLEMLNDGI